MGRPEPHHERERQDAALAAAAALATLTDRRGRTPMDRVRRLAQLQDRRGGQDKLLKVVQYVARLGALACAPPDGSGGEEVESALAKRLRKLDKTIGLSRKVSKTGTAAKHVPALTGLAAFLMHRVATARGRRRVPAGVSPGTGAGWRPGVPSAPDPVAACVAVGNAVYVVFDNLAWLTKYGVLLAAPRARRNAAADRLARISALGEIVELIADMFLRRRKLRETFRVRDQVNNTYNALLRQQEPVQPGVARIVELDDDDDGSGGLNGFDAGRTRAAAQRGSELLSASAEMEALSGAMDNELMLVLRNALDVVEAACTVTEPLWGTKAILSPRTRARLQLVSAVLSARDAWLGAGRQ